MKKRIQNVFVGMLLSSLFACNFIGNKTEEIKLYPVKSGENYQYIDQEGKIVINPQFSEASLFRNGLAMVRTFGENPKWGFIGEDGKFVINAIYENATVFSEDLAWVVSKNSEPLAIDTKGQVKITLKDAESVRIFRGGLAAYDVLDVSGTKWGFVDKEGKVKINPQFAGCGNFSDGKCAVQNKEGKWGYIDKDGKIIINYQFDYALDFNNGKAVVTSGEKAGVIDETGKYFINPQFTDIKIDNDIFMVEQDGKWGWCDNQGKISINPQFDDAYCFFNNDLAAVRSGENWAYVDKEGKISINPQFENALPFSGNLALVYSSEKVGFINQEGKYVINPQFDGVSNDLYHFLVNASTTYESVQTDFFNMSAITNRLKLSAPEGLSLNSKISALLNKFALNDDYFNKYSQEHAITSEIIGNEVNLDFYVIGDFFIDVPDGWYSKRVIDNNADIGGFGYKLSLSGRGYGKAKELREAIEKTLVGFTKDQNNSSNLMSAYTNSTKDYVIYLLNNDNTVFVSIKKSVIDQNFSFINDYLGVSDTEPIGYPHDFSD